MEKEYFVSMFGNNNYLLYYIWISIWKIRYFFCFWKNPYKKTPFCLNILIRSSGDWNDLFSFLLFGVFIQLNSLMTLFMYIHICFMIRKSMNSSKIGNDCKRRKRSLKKGIFLWSFLTRLFGYFYFFMVFLFVFFCTCSKDFFS